MADYVPQIDYSSRDYLSLREDMVANISNFAPQWTSRDSSDLGIVLIDLFAYMGDIMSFYIDRAANESFLSTATQRSSIVALASMYGYTPDMGISAVTNLEFTNNGASSVWVTPRFKVATSTIMNSGASPVVFETMNTDNVEVAPGDTVSIESREGETVTYEELTYSFNGLPNQGFKITNNNVEIYSMNVYVDDVPYSRVEHLIDADGNANVYSTAIDSEGSTYVLFGDNIGGRVPKRGAVIWVEYRVINGTSGNVSANSLVYSLSPYVDGTGAEAAATVSITNPDAAYGGTAPESTASIRYNAPRSLRAVNRAITLDDYASLATQVVGVGKAQADAAVYSHVILYMGMTSSPGVDSFGSPTADWTALSGTVSTFFADKIPAGSSVTVTPPTMVPVDVEVNVTVNSAYNATAVKTAVNASISNWLAYDTVTFGQRVTLQDLSLALGLTDGVLHSSVVKMEVHGSPALPPVDIQCTAGQIPYLNSLTVNVSGGI